MAVGAASAQSRGKTTTAATDRLNRRTMHLQGSSVIIPPNKPDSEKKKFSSKATRYY
jgi:hypothetical protein